MPEEQSEKIEHNEQTHATAAQVITAYLSSNRINLEDLPTLIETVFETCHKVMGETPAVEEAGRHPAVAVKHSVTDSYIICLEDGLKFKALRRHLMTSYGLSPKAYRERWNLPDDYPMTAPAYSRQRSEIARKIVGLGRKKKT